MATILIVEDSKVQQFEMTKIIEKLGHSAISADNGASGVLMAKEQMPDLILMDIVMPELDGFHATRQIFKDPKTCDIPIIMCSTKDQETDKVWSARQGARAYVTKPIDKKELITALNEYL
jgi:twitching motility two-component system response regulator PilH